MNLAIWSIRNPIPAILLFVALSLLGIQGFGSLAIQNLPDIELPTVIVTLSQPGAAPAQLETDVARKVENALSAVAGIKHLRTTISDGQVQIVAEFILEKKLTDALNDVKNAVDQVRTNLPADLQQPFVSAVTVGSTAVDQYAVDASNLNEEELSWYVDDKVSKAVLGIAGVGSFERVGGMAREVRIEVDSEKLASLGITTTDISAAMATNQQQSSGGHLHIGQLEQSVRTISLDRQAGDLLHRQIALPDKRTIELSQVGRVKDTNAERTQSAILDGKRVVGFRIYRAKGSDEVSISHEVARVLAELHHTDQAVVFTLISSRSTYTQEQYNGSMRMLIDGALLAILVVWWFLRDWRATLIAASALPLSILPAFAFMHWMGYTLNTLTLLALSVVVGILVDDAIVEIENIERHIAMQKSILQATTDAVTEIALAVIATTLTLVAVFIPTALMGGMPGLFFRQFGWTAVVAILSSLLVARILTPMMAVYFLKPGRPKTTANSALMNRYMHMLNWCLKYRGTTMLIALLVFISSLALIPLLETGFLPSSEKGYTTITFDLPPGSSLAMSEATAESARKLISTIAGVERVFASIGSPSSVGQDDATAGKVESGTLLVTLAPRTKRASQKSIEEQMNQALEKIPGARFETGGEKLELILASDDGDALLSSVSQVVSEMRNIKGLSNISSTASIQRPELIIRPDLQRAAEMGISAEVIGQTIRVATSGDVTQRLAKLNLDNRQIPIKVILSDAARSHMDTIGMLQVPSKNATVPLSGIAHMAFEGGASEINRYDRKRFVTISADIGSTSLGTALSEAKALPAIVALRSDVSLLEAGNTEIMKELLGGFVLAMLTGIISVLGVLILLFKDVLQPFTILTPMPLAMGGAFIGLLIGHAELDVPSMIGLIMLMGIVTKNSILIVEYAMINMRDLKLSAHDAILDACHKRARPIFMTTLAMIAGMLPIAFGLGADASFRQPMAVAVIGGLVTSTLLSLLIVPVSCSYVAQFEAWLFRNKVPPAYANR